MTKRLKPVELFLSLGLVATLATSCGGPTDGGEELEGDTDITTEEPMEGEPMEGAPMEGEPMEEGEEGGEGGEG